ncbi:MAG: DUF1272 domain-containing protein [Burkholderiaceae bacterium]
MLEMRPGCECCDAEIATDQDIAWICSLECTFCATCAEHVLGFVCPNCGGEMTARPRRASKWWEKFPPSRVRVHKPESCEAIKAGRS